MMVSNLDISDIAGLIYDSDSESYLVLKDDLRYFSLLDDIDGIFLALVHMLDPYVWLESKNIFWSCVQRIPFFRKAADEKLKVLRK